MPASRFPLPASLLMLAVSGRADAVTINAASCVAQPDNVLRFDCSVETDTPASVELRFCDATVGGSGCSKTRTRAAGAGVASSTCTVGSACTLYDLTVYNLISGHDYEWHAHAADATSSDVWTAVPPDDVFTPAALPSPGLAGIDLSIEVSGTTAMQNVLFNYGCTEDSFGSPLIG
ncbi:MAG: hypothetical protein D6798_21025 [Deltaproteobacteria bacterium]|nr:MAG: hypothetical protein D6798_21025 [Deltaproteobacteria bacterium]